ncbi:MAG: hypothetical protein A2285_05240 [Elusimicrobia bacterium RIFOXYA12_FULL_57_11]|nr:MAG: hypothetical protein A2285_05240 [Elusimicrobia bacterium RIFOXYA12_FULL_57_11]
MSAPVPGIFSFQARSNLPGFFLALAFFCGGLRVQGGWLAFAVIFLPWFAFGRAPFAPGARPWALLFFVWLALAALFSPAPAVSWAAFARYLIPGLVFFMAASAREGEANWLGAVLVLGTVCAAALVTQEILGRSVTGLIGLNPNYTAAFAAAAFPAALLAAGGGSAVKKTLAAALAVLLAAGLLAAGSRGALLAAFLSSAAALALTRSARGLALLVCGALAAFLLLPEAFLGGLVKLQDARAFERPRLWGAALEIAAEYPFFGAGPGLFERAFEIFKFPYFDGTAFYGHSTLHAHGELFNLAAEAGVPAAVFFVSAFVAALWRGAKRSPPLAACALAVFIQGSADIVFHSGAVALLFWGTLGFLAPRAGDAGGPGKTARAALALFCFAGLLAGLWPGAFNGVTDNLRRGAYEQASAGRTPALNLALLRYAALENPKNPFAARAAGAAAAAAGNMDRAEKDLKTALALEPFFYGARLDLAKVYAAQGRGALGCAQLGILDKQAPGVAVNGYQRALTDFNRPQMRRLKKELCLRTRPGAVIAPTRKTR